MFIGGTMKNAILAGVFGVLMFTTAFVVYDHATVAAANEECAGECEEYGGPLRNLFKKRPLRKRKQREVEMVETIPYQSQQ